MKHRICSQTHFPNCPRSRERKIYQIGCSIAVTRFNLDLSNVHLTRAVLLFAKVIDRVLFGLLLLPSGEHEEEERAREKERRG